MPDQLILERDILLNTPYIADWVDIGLRKQKIIDKNNQLENKNRKPHTYIIRKKVFLHNKKENKYEDPFIGPYPTTQV